VDLGINFRNFGPSATPENLRGWVRFAEDAGFTIAMTSDHVALTPDVAETYPAPFYDPFVTFAWLAAETRAIRLGTTVNVVPLRHPLLTARLAANVDRFSAGRFVLGVAPGWSRQEYEALGLDFDARGRATDECLEIITNAWRADTVSARGASYAFEDVATGPRPAHVPVWVGGAGPPALRRAARFGQAWHPVNARLDWLRDTGLPALREAAEAIGRPVPRLCPRMQLRITDRPAHDRMPGTGTFEQVQEDLEAYERLGADTLVLDTNPDDPHDRRGLTVDQRILATVAERWLR